MVLAGLATLSPASLDKPGHSLCYGGIGQASCGFSGFLSLVSPAYGWAKWGLCPDQALTPVSPSLTGFLMQGKHEFPFVCLWKSGTLSPLNTMFSCTLQTISTKIVLLTSKPHPRTASIHTVNFGSYRPSPWLNLINPGMRYYNRHACYRRNVALFCPFCEQEGETTYFGRLNNYFVKQTKHSWSRSLPTTTAPGLKEWQLLKAEVEDFDFFFVNW